MRHLGERPVPWPDLGVYSTIRRPLGALFILGVVLVASVSAFVRPHPSRPPARHPGLSHHTIRSSASPQARASHARSRARREQRAAHVNAHRQRIPESRREAAERRIESRQEAAEQVHETRHRTAMTLHPDRQEWEALRRHVYYTRGDYYDLSCERSVKTIDGYLYYRCGSAWFERVYYEGQVVYVVIEPPEY